MIEQQQPRIKAKIRTDILTFASIYRLRATFLPSFTGSLSVSMMAQQPTTSSTSLSRRTVLPTGFSTRG